MNKVSDNVELDFPARMNDGRQFTDYRPNCYINSELGQNMGSWQYRQYLTRNAESLIKQNTSKMEENTSCKKCVGATIPDVKNVLDCTNQTKCYYNLKDKNGLGQGRKY